MKANLKQTSSFFRKLAKNLYFCEPPITDIAASDNAYNNTKTPKPKMKKTSIYLIITAAVLLMAVSQQSCKHRDMEYDDLSWLDTTLNQNHEDVSEKILTLMEWPNYAISEIGTQTHLIFKATEPWKIVVDPKVKDWVTVKPDQGNPGKITAMITVDKNAGHLERNAAITIMAGDAQETITLTQKQTNAIIATISKIEVEAEGGQISVEVKSNVEYMQTIDKGARSWILPATSKDITTRVHKYNIPENLSTGPRQGTIKYTGSDTEETVVIYQKGSSESLVLSSNNYHVPQEGGEIVIEVLSNSQFNVKDPNVEWLRRNVEKTHSSYTLYYNVAENRVTDSRKCFIVVSSHDLSQKDTIYITQDKFIESLEVTSEKDISTDNSAADIKVKVSANTGYTIEMPKWITGPEEADEGDNEHKFSISQNPTYDERTGKIIFTNYSGTHSDTVVVTQTQKVDGLTIVSYPTETLAQESASYQVTLMSNDRWVVTVEEGCRTWLLTEPASGEKNETSFWLKTTTNNTYDDRTGSITIKSGKIVKTLIFTQEGLESILELNDSEGGVAIPFTGGEATITVYCNVEYKVEYPAWASCKNPMGAPGTNKHVMYVPENETLTDLSGEIKISTLNGKKTISLPIVQDRHTALLEIRNVNKYVLETSGGDALIQFITNNDWTATVSDDAKWWMFLNPKYGGKAGNTDLVVTASMNEAFEDRYGTVTLTAGPKERTFTFKQPAAEPTVMVIDNLPVEAVYGGQLILAKVTANVDFNIEMPDWITGPVSGTKGDATMRFNVKANPDYEKREGQIKFTNSEYSITDIIEVSQEPKIDEIKAFASNLSFASKKGFSAFDLNASDDWTAEVSDSWITISPANGTRGKTTIETRVTDFVGIDPRSGQITFTCGRASTTVTVTQAPVDAYINVESDPNITADYLGRSFEVDVNTNTDFSISMPDWITGPSEGKAGSSKLEFTISRNDAYSKRNGTIQLFNTEHNANNKVTVVQDLKIDVVKLIEEPQTIVPAAGGKVTVKFYASDNWSIQHYEDSTPSMVSGEAGEHTLEIEVAPNTAIYGRTVVLKIICGKTGKLVEISQSKNR